MANQGYRSPTCNKIGLLSTQPLAGVSCQPTALIVAGKFSIKPAKLPITKGPDTEVHFSTPPPPLAGVRVPPPPPCPRSNFPVALEQSALWGWLDEGEPNGGQHKLVELAEEGKRPKERNENTWGMRN